MASSSQTDSATRCVNQNLANCTKNKLYDKSTANRSHGVLNVLAQLTVVSNRQTYRACYIYRSRLHLMLYIAMWLARLVAVIVVTLLVVVLLSLVGP